VSWLTAASAVDSDDDNVVVVGGGDDYEHVVDDDEHVVEYVDEDSDDEEAASLHARSCIGVRKRCLVDGRCARHLADYRHYCRENKKQNQCVAVER